MLSGLSRIFRKPFANVHISRKVAFAHVWQIYACGPRSCKTFHGFLHGVHIYTQHYTILQDINVTVPIPRTLLLPPPNSLLLGFSMQPRCVRLSVGGCVRLPGPLSLVVSFSLPSFVLLVAVGG